MRLVGIRRALHNLYAVVTLALIATGLPILLPDLRAWLFGGYGRVLLDVHVWAGWVAIALPVLALTLASRPLLRDLRGRLGPPDGLTWAKVHIVLELGLGLVLVVTGLVLYFDTGLPYSVTDLMIEVHDYAGWALTVLLPLHVVTRVRKVGIRARRIFGFRSDPASATHGPAEAGDSRP